MRREEDGRARRLAEVEVVREVPDD